MTATTTKPESVWRKNSRPDRKESAVNKIQDAKNLER
jgi:hypothetical protein